MSYDFTPQFAGQQYAKSSGSMQRGMGGGGMGTGGGGSNRGGGGGNRDNMGGYRDSNMGGGARGSSMQRFDAQPAQRVIESFNRSVKLNTSENAWKPTVATGKKVDETLGPDEAKTEVSGALLINEN